MSKHIKRSKIIRSYDGLDREEKTGGLMAMRVVVILLIISFVGFCTAMLVYNIIDENKSLLGNDGSQVRYHAYTEEEAQELIRFYNASYPLPEGYAADIVELGGQIYVNRLALDDLKAMISAAREDGVELTVVRGYTDEAECERIFSSVRGEFERQGATQAQAESMAREIFPSANMNEYRTGLLIKLSDDDSYAFSKSKAYQWIYRNGISYGFINRYTGDKKDITGLEEDLTVYRYVGVDNAEKMRSYGMCLEEYYDYCSFR